VAAAFAFMMSPREPRERACHYTGRPDLYTLNLRVGARVRILLVLVRVSGAKRPSFVLLSPSVHAATVNRYTAACMESKEDEEAWRSARERKRAPNSLTSWVPTRVVRSLAHPTVYYQQPAAAPQCTQRTYFPLVGWLLSRIISSAAMRARFPCLPQISTLAILLDCVGLLCARALARSPSGSCKWHDRFEYIIAALPKVEI
jgi:hypothetical protein